MKAASLDLVQFHVWQDEWADDPGWQGAVDGLRREGLARHVGISVNRREPANVLRTLRTGLIDAVQVVYNIFDQAPEDELLPVCGELGIAVIARVPLDEGSLAGTLTLDSRWPDGDWRNTYFSPASLAATIPRGRGAPRARAGGADDGPARVALHPVEPAGDHRHSRHAPAGAPGGKRGRGRGRPTPRGPPGGSPRPPLGPPAFAGLAVLVSPRARLPASATIPRGAFGGQPQRASIER